MMQCQAMGAFMANSVPADIYRSCIHGHEALMRYKTNPGPWHSIFEHSRVLLHHPIMNDIRCVIQEKPAWSHVHEQAKQCIEELRILLPETLLTPYAEVAEHIGHAGQQHENENVHDSNVECHICLSPALFAKNAEWGRKCTPFQPSELNDGPLCEIKQFIDLVTKSFSNIHFMFWSSNCASTNVAMSKAKAMSLRHGINVIEMNKFQDKFHIYAESQNAGWKMPRMSLNFAQQPRALINRESAFAQAVYG